MGGGYVFLSYHKQCYEQILANKKASVNLLKYNTNKLEASRITIPCYSTKTFTNSKAKKGENFGRPKKLKCTSEPSTALFLNYKE